MTLALSIEEIPYPGGRSIWIGTATKDGRVVHRTSRHWVKTVCQASLESWAKVHEADVSSPRLTSDNLTELVPDWQRRRAIVLGHQ